MVPVIPPGQYNKLNMPPEFGKVLLVQCSGESGVTYRPFGVEMADLDILKPC